jgi:hypothetical protein
MLYVAGRVLDANINICGVNELKVRNFGQTQAQSGYHLAQAIMRGCKRGCKSTQGTRAVHPYSLLFKLIWPVEHDLYDVGVESSAV